MVLRANGSIGPLYFQLVSSLKYFLRSCLPRRLITNIYSNVAVQYWSPIYMRIYSQSRTYILFLNSIAHNLFISILKILYWLLDHTYMIQIKQLEAEYTLQPCALKS